MTSVDAQFTEYRTAALFNLNATGRILSVNEPHTKQITPRLYITRTADKVVGHIQQDVPNRIFHKLEQLIASEPASRDFSAPLEFHQQYIELLTSLAPVSAMISGPAYTLPELTPSANAIIVERDKIHVLIPHFPVTAEMYDFRQPILAVLDDDIAVSVCFCARKTEFIAEAGLFTAETHRKRGYAVAVVSGWAQAVRQLGIQPIYSTSWDNIGSQAVANKLGGILFAADFSYR